MSPAGSKVATVAVFALAGPPFAAFLITAAMSWRGFIAMPELIPLSLLISIPLGYLLGVVPALLSGLVAVWLSSRMDHPWAWLVASTIAGAVICGAVGPLVGFGGNAVTTLGRVGLFAAGGAAAAAFCALICFSFRPRSEA